MLPHTCFFRYQFVVLALLLSFTVNGQQGIPMRIQADRLQNARTTEQLALQRNDSLLLAEAWYLYGKTYVFAGDYRMAQRYFLKSLSIHEPRESSFELGRLYVRLSEIKLKQDDVRDALRYINLSIDVFKKAHSDEGLMRSYGALGQLYEDAWQNEWPSNPAKADSILACYREVERLGYQLKDTMGIAEGKLQAGSFLTKLNDPKAVPYLEKALELMRIKQKIGIRVNAMTHLAEAYLMVNKPALAYQMLCDAEALYTSSGLNEHDNRLNIEQIFAAYYEATGQWEKAYARLRKFHELERLILLEDRKGAISRLNVEYETGKKEALLKTQKRELSLRKETIQTHQRFTVATLALLVMAVSMSVVFFQLYRRNKRISRRNEVLLKEQNHRVKNNLQIVSSLLNLQSRRLTDAAAKRAIEESRLRVQSMAIVHRRLYDGDELAEVKLADFLEEVATNSLRAFGYGNIVTRFAIDEVSLVADKAISLGLIVNELVTNACKYAFSYVDEPLLMIRCQKQDHAVLLIVADNGPGLSDWRDADNHTGQVEVVPKKSFGMTLIQAQVAQLEGTYSFQTGLDDSLTGTVFRLEFTM